MEATTLVVGESGVGKEVVSQEIHRLSDRNGEPFVAINCAAIPETLIESELFGHASGAFTDARRAHRGAFEQAGRGTLLLDEIGELSLASQPKLLRALECGEIFRVGGETPYRFHARLIASTNQDLKSLCRQRLFRSDLYYRLCVIEIRIPPLRERLEDVDVLTDHFLQQFGHALNRRSPLITECGRRALRAYPWPGNVRELKHIIERSMALSSGSTLTADAFDLDRDGPTTALADLLTMNWRDAKRGLAEIYARELIRRHKGSVSEAAKDAGVSTGGFYKWLRKLEIDT